MEATVEKIGDIIIFTPMEAYLDVSNVKEFKDNVETLVDPESMVVFDLSQLEFVDSSGLGTFVAILKRFKAAGGDLKMCGMAPSVCTLFELAQAHKIFATFSTKEEAICAFHAWVQGAQTE